jgi:hypothetical protein
MFRIPGRERFQGFYLLPIQTTVKVGLQLDFLHLPVLSCLHRPALRTLICFYPPAIYQARPQKVSLPAPKDTRVEGYIKPSGLRSQGLFPDENLPAADRYK